MGRGKEPHLLKIVLKKVKQDDPVLNDAQKVKLLHLSKKLTNFTLILFSIYELFCTPIIFMNEANTTKL